MIKKIILSTFIAISVAHSSSNDSASVESDIKINEKTKYAAWNPPMGKKVSGESCKDGNCITDLNCMTKDGKVYKFIISLRDKVKKKCRKL